MARALPEPLAKPSCGFQLVTLPSSARLTSAALLRSLAFDPIELKRPATRIVWRPPRPRRSPSPYTIGVSLPRGAGFQSVTTPRPSRSISASALLGSPPIEEIEPPPT